MKTKAISRRDALRALGLSAGGALLLGSATTTSSAAVRAYSIGRVALEVDGTTTFLSAAEGGNAFVDVLPEPLIGDLVQHKQAGTLSFDDLLIQLPMTGWQPLAGWIESTLVKGPTAKNGALVYLDFNNNEVKRLEFFNAVITEVTLPACDAVGKDAANLTLRLAPESSRLLGPSGKPAAAPGAAPKRTYVYNYRLNIQGLEAGCTRISSVLAISAKRALQPVPAGIERREKMERLFSPLDCSALSITLPESDGGLFYAWFNDFAIKGNNSPKGERAARLEWLNPVDGKSLVIADLGNLGIVRYAPVAGGAGDTIARVQVDMYCETLRLGFAA